MKKYKNIIKKVAELRCPEIEKTVFSIGGRGHYENPISDILAFFINPKEEHGFGELFLQSLFDCAGKEPPRLELVANPQREEPTDSGNRIDLVVEGDNWLLVIENKIRHDCINPFEDYERFVHSHYPNKVPIYILLSIKEEIPPDGWINVTYKNYLDSLKSNIGVFLLAAKNTKWHVILREFILNIESEYSNEEMSDERLKFIENNYADIQEIQNMQCEYIEHMKNQGKSLLNNVSKCKQKEADVKQHNWDDNGIALHFHSQEWMNNATITLVLLKTGSLRVQIYFYDVQDDHVDSIKSCIDMQKYKTFKTEGKTKRCFGFFDSNDHDQIFSEISDIAQRMNSFYAKP